MLSTLDAESYFDENKEANKDAVTVVQLLKWVAMGRHLRYNSCSRRPLIFTPSALTCSFTVVTSTPFSLPLPRPRHTNVCLEKAKSIADGSLLEVYLYCDKMHFLWDEMTNALAKFEMAANLDPCNTTPHVNTVLAVVNALGLGNGPPNMYGAVCMLEQALLIDLQFHAAYVHLSQVLSPQQRKAFWSEKLPVQCIYLSPIALVSSKQDQSEL